MAAFEVLALRLVQDQWGENLADVTVELGPLTITGCLLRADRRGEYYVSFPRGTRARSRVHCAPGEERNALTKKAVALYRAMLAAEEPVAKASHPEPSP